MFNNLKPYPTYKDSGELWLGEVPEHWEIKSLGSLTQPLNQRGSPNLPLLSVVREKGVILRASMSDEENHNYVPDDLSNYKVVRKGNLVINKMKAWQGSMGIANQDGVVSPAYFVYDLNIEDLYFGHNLLRSKPYVALFGRASDGVRIGQWDLSPSGMKRITVVLPPLHEQTAIVRYLDYMDRRIRRYINAKKRLIALLNEQKQAITHWAVTRGLDPNVRLKPSGVEWLGDIPEHWEVRRLKFLANTSTGGKDTVNREDDGVYPFFVRSQKVEHINTFSFDGEAVLTAGDGAGVAKVFHYVNGKFDYHQRVYKFSNFLRVKGKFFFYYLKTNLRFEALDASAKSTVDSLRLPMLQNFAVVLPPIDEQNTIVGWIELKSIPFNAAIERAQLQIKLLREYRTRLITDVVTGKLDVREVAANLPEETQEEPIEETEGLTNIEEEVNPEKLAEEAIDA